MKCTRTLSGAFYIPGCGSLYLPGKETDVPVPGGVKRKAVPAPDSRTGSAEGRGKSCVFNTQLLKINIFEEMLQKQKEKLRVERRRKRL